MSAACPLFGFVVELETASALADDELQNLRQSLRSEVLEPRGLTFADRFAGRQWSFTVRSEASQATHADQQAVEAWAATRAEVLSARVGSLVDFAGAG
jgi:uncharacterized protein YggL (DUF469 family)